MSIVYSNDLLSSIDRSVNKLHEIISKLSDDNLINQGLFLMSTTFFEATLRDVMNKILISNPEKLKKDNFTINKYDLSSLGDSIILKNVIENELFNLFKGNVKEQLIYIIELIANIKSSNLKNKSKNEEIINVIIKCSDISIYRNCLVHNLGEKSKNFDESVQYYISEDNKLNFSTQLIKIFIEDYLSFFKMLKEKIQKNSEFKEKTRLERLRQLWDDCFGSPLLNFDDYWLTDIKQDLIVKIKYPDSEHGLSSSERIYLSIWRHQYYNSIKTEEFLLCSVDENKLYKIYKVLSEVEFYYMYQQANPIRN
ncbi:hypothetical protein [Paenibacillus arenosi]|uniref:Uncharacterized protein n=1 Tax=Paenibacillus arenosi TaxID=2774142 RepID=A0ABR9AS30_9BACL|nr:hypothetical protein [Paenibacillus arenosi]MBD8496904.1 hypothetical protein [Paenibacillus arenosi]